MSRENIIELEIIILGYVERYGLTERARRYFVNQSSKINASAQCKLLSNEEECGLEKQGK
ncbi:hypothetical protein SAMN05444414_11127 [Roseovarius marisflavi]|uniref:Uncharacterized protein n=1 Tax=Roseovarius marisflavi TaxID=1054996 RepID=A0A1M6ZST0_9RHOB|nr:hypothetical protein SAMN05444414_11127 [Roseovarius marisflavi]